jgi:hypothetical protein
MLGMSLHVIKKNTEALLFGSKENGVEVSYDKTNYMVLSRDNNAGRSHNIKIDNSSFEMVKMFRYFWNNLKKSKFSSGRNGEQIDVRECLLSFGAESFFFQFAIRNLKIKLYRSVMLPVLLYGCKTWSLTLKE